MSSRQITQAEIFEAIRQGAAQPIRKVRVDPGRVIARPVFDATFTRQAARAEALREAQAAAGLGPDITNVTATVVLEEVMNLTRPKYLMRNACRVVNMPNLVGTIRVATKGSAQQNVPAGVTPDFKKIVYAKEDYDLSDYKDVYAFAIPEEDAMKSNTNLVADHSEDAAGALAQAENAKIGAVLEATVATQASLGVWATSTNNPYSDLAAARSTVYAATGLPGNVVSADPIVWADFFGNPNTKFGQSPGGLIQYPDEQTPFPIPGMAGMIGLSDPDMAIHTHAIVCNNRNAIGQGDGPTVSEQYRNAEGGWDGYIFRHWNRPKALVALGAVRITGVKT
jgi:hypothetical protein